MRSAAVRRGLETTFLRVDADRRTRFWILQLGGWAGLCVVTFFSLTLWYNTLEWSYIAHIFVQAGIGLFLSLGMREGFRRIWSLQLKRRVFLAGSIVLAASFLWTALRIETFEMITAERDVWSDFGGWFFGSLMVLLSWSLTYHGVKFYELMVEARARAKSALSDAAQEQVKRLTAEGLARDAQLKMLRYQLNPHFLFNALNSISALIQTHRRGDADAMVRALSRFLRYSLEADPGVSTTLAQEIETVDLYLDIERKRYGDRLAVRVDIEEETLNAVVPTMILQPLIENSVKFAIANQSAAGWIGLRTLRRNDMLSLVLTDSGPGFSSIEEPSEGSQRGVGLRNIRQRLEAEYGPDHAVHVEPGEPGRWSLTLTFPFETAEDLLSATP